MDMQEAIRTYGDDLPTREGMRAPHKSRHSAARFTTRTRPYVERGAR